MYDNWFWYNIAPLRLDLRMLLLSKK